MNNLLFITLCTLGMCSCNKPVSELDGLTRDVLKEDQGIVIKIEPEEKLK